MALKGMELWCRHHRGIQHDTCEAGVNYMSVRDTTGPGMAKWPCTTANQGVVIACPLFEAYTQAEIDERDRQVSEALDGMAKLMSRETDVCFQCGKQITAMSQIGRCVYADCGCRLWQGTVPNVWKEAPDEPTA